MSSSSRLSKRDCAQLRGQVRDLGYGQAERETPDLLVRRFYPVPEHLRALDPGVVLVVGPRGAGKSELFKVFFSDDGELSRALRRRAPRSASEGLGDGGATWMGAYPSGTRFPDGRALADHVRSDQSAKDLWYAMLVRCLSGEFRDDQKNTIGTLLSPMAANLGEIFQAASALGAFPLTGLLR
ncbi:MAG: hypothetical protein IIA08_07060 [Proteobacteria bacterium]|nr:hypothetical protein [Pseudomonadota bacterium]